MRLITAGAIAVFLFRAIPQFELTPTTTLGLTIVGEIVTICIYLFSRFPKATRIDGISLVSTFVATFYFYFILLEPRPAVVPVFVSNSIQLSGILLQITSKAFLGRSFGLLPANKGVVVNGPYQLVRHPIYLGYLIGHIGFLLGSFSVYNLSMFMALYFFQCIRIYREEGLLKNDPAYSDYTLKTRYRLIPFIW